MRHVRVCTALVAGAAQRLELSGIRSRSRRSRLQVSHAPVAPGPPLQGTTWSAVLRDIATHPLELLHQWNWKSACLSAAVRSTIFFAANLPSGRSAAVAAFTTEIWLRLATSGFYGGLTQRLGAIEPEWQAVLAATVILPIVSHGLEIAVHLARGTPELLVSILASAALTVLSTSFNVFAMRRGALTTGAGSQPLHRDLLRLPWLIVCFVLAPARAAWRRIIRARHLGQSA